MQSRGKSHIVFVAVVILELQLYAALSNITTKSDILRLFPCAPELKSEALLISPTFAEKRRRLAAAAANGDLKFRCCRREGLHRQRQTWVRRGKNLQTFPSLAIF